MSNIDLPISINDIRIDHELLFSLSFKLRTRMAPVTVVHAHEYNQKHPMHAVLT